MMQLFPSQAKVSTIIQENRWNRPITNTIELMEIEAPMDTMPTPSSRLDSITWSTSPNGMIESLSKWTVLYYSHATVLERKSL